MQLTLDQKYATYYPPKSQLLKWVGNKQRMAAEISKHFPIIFNRFFEPFLGSGAMTATVAPNRGIGSDVFKPLVEIWTTLANNPNELISWYSERVGRLEMEDKKEVYEEIKSSYNTNPNGADFLFLSRACYGGIVRFRKSDGYMSTPCGAHNPIPITSFEKRVTEWYNRMKNVEFHHMDYQEAFAMAKKGDFIYCDPPYSHSQSILYGAQDFSLQTLLERIDKAKSKGIHVALSIDGNKKSGNYICDLPIPKGLFAQEMLVKVGRSMLKRFQMEGQTLEKEMVHDRLLLTY